MSKDDISPTLEGEANPNLSTEHQKKGDAKAPSDTLDRDRPPAQDDGGRKSSLTHNS